MRGGIAPPIPGTDAVGDVDGPVEPDEVECVALTPAASATHRKPRKSKMMWSPERDIIMLRVLNTIGALRVVGHGKKGPAFKEVADLLTESPVFTGVPAQSQKSVMDHFAKLVDEHHALRKLQEASTGTDDEEVNEKIILLDEIREALDDENYRKELVKGVADKKRVFDQELVEAGAEIRQMSMKRMKSRLDAEASPSVATNLPGNDGDGPHNRGRASRVTPGRSNSTTGGPARVTAAAGAPKSASRGGAGEAYEMAMIVAAEQRASHQLDIERERLDMDKAQQARQLAHDEKAMEMEGRKLAFEESALELKRSQQEADASAATSRLRLEQHRFELERDDRIAERKSRESSTKTMPIWLKC